MNKLSKTQRDQLIGIAVGVVGLVIALWYFVVTDRQAELVSTRKKSGEMAQKLRDAENLMRRGDEIDSTLASRSQLLAKRESGLAPDRDSYAWFMDTINNFARQRGGLHIDTCDQPSFSDVGIIPKFPYRWATFHVKATGYFQDIGKFTAAFENSYPYFHIEDPNLAANTGFGTEAEKLSVTFNVVAPVTDIK